MSFGESWAYRVPSTVTTVTPTYRGDRYVTDFRAATVTTVEPPVSDWRLLRTTPVKGLSVKVPTFGTSGFAVTLLRLAIRSPLHQRRVLARYRCSEALRRHTRRQTMLTSSDAALAKSFAAAR